MPDPRPLSLATVRVLTAIAGGARHGFDIMDAAELASGTVYPILARLEKAGLVRGRWEAPSTAQRDKRPPRRYYEITGAGDKALVRSVEYYRTLGGIAGGVAFPRPSRG
jgi:PadR family transcriptional regulator, regulatory protein PadR